MLNIVWPIFIIISIIYSIFLGNLDNLNQSIFESTSTAVNLCLTLIGTMCLWSGIMKIASETSFSKKITNFLRPFMKILFPNLKRESKLYNEISMNMVANILGLGNAATPLGIKAMNTMQKENANKEILTNDMAVFYCFKYGVNTDYSNYCYSNKKLTRFTKSGKYYSTSVGSNYMCGNSWNNCY